jgi:hypothetical protein
MRLAAGHWLDRKEPVTVCGVGWGRRVRLPQFAPAGMIPPPMMGRLQ